MSVEGRPGPDDVRTVAVIGTGVIGGGWAAHFLRTGQTVVTATDGALSASATVTVAGAKLSATSAALRVAAGAHQICGGWGYLADSGLHSYTRTIKAAESQLGTPFAVREMIARSSPSITITGYIND